MTHSNQLYGNRHMVTEYLYNKTKNMLVPLQGLLLLVSSKYFYRHHSSDNIVHINYHGLCCNSCRAVFPGLNIKFGLCLIPVLHIFSVTRLKRPILTAAISFALILSFTFITALVTPETKADKIIIQTIMKNDMLCLWFRKL